MEYYVSSGVPSDGIILSGFDTMIVFYCGSANNTTINDASMLIFSGGIANNTTVNSGGRLYVSGGTANSNTVNSGCMYVSGGGTADCTTVNGGSMFVFAGGNMFFPSSGGTANNTTVNSGGNVYVSSGGTANNTTVNSGCCLYVSSGGTANNTIVNGNQWGRGMLVSSGGTANDTTVNSDGEIDIYGGGIVYNVKVCGGGRIGIDARGKLTGHMTFESGAVVATYGGATVDFDLTQTSAGAAALVNDLSVFDGEFFLYTLTVDGTQRSGDYAIAGKITTFSSTISVVDTSGTFLGMVSLGHKLVTQNTSYTLNLVGNSLTVTVRNPLFFTGAFDGGNKALLAREYEDMAVIWKDGASWKLNRDLNLGTFAGAGDFDGDGRTDVLRLHYSGLVIGEMSDGDGTFEGTLLNKLEAGWSIAGIGDFSGNGTDDVLVVNPAGASETVGLVGYWESGREWRLINGYSPEWECVATGDFNGDGKCDMLWRNSFEGDGGQTCNAFCTWIVDDPVDWRMVSVANPDEWKFLCAGDFDGNGAGDIAMINDVGVVGIWGVTDGYLSSWSILSAVNTAEWSLVGVDDFNGDGTDDIAWFNADAGIAGFWQIENRELSTWQNLATLL